MSSWCKSSQVLNGSTSCLQSLWSEVEKQLTFPQWSRRGLLDPIHLFLGSSPHPILDGLPRYHVLPRSCTCAIIRGLLRPACSCWIHPHSRTNDWSCVHPRHVLLSSARTENRDLDFAVPRLSLLWTTVWKLHHRGHRILESGDVACFRTRMLQSRPHCSFRG